MTTLISREKLSNFFGENIRENVAVLYFLAFDNFDFTRKIVKLFLLKKFVKMLRFCTFLALDNFYFTRKSQIFFGKKIHEIFFFFQMTRVSNVQEIFLRNLVKSMKKFKLLKWWFYYVYLRALYNEKCAVIFFGKSIIQIMLPFLETVFLPLVKKIRFWTTQIDNLKKKLK